MDRKEILKKSIEYFGGDELAANVWINKYALKDSEGNIFESDPNDMHKRLSKEIARIEKKYINPLSEEEIFDLLKDFKYIIPQGGPMSGIGNNKQVSSLSNCFVIGNEYDSYGSIMLTDQEQVQLMKRRGGVGHDLSHLRPSGTPVNNSALTSTGVVSFMNRYSNSTREVGQDGRRGALMLSCDIKNIDAEAFMDAKLDTNKITGANVSLKISDEFMESVINNKPFFQQYPLNSDNPSMINEVDSERLFKKIVHNAWKSAEPGILWWDTIIRESVPDCYSEFGYKTTSTNPCIVGDTIIATADGRNGVSIKQLVEEGKDVPVYTLDNNGKLCIRTMRNPRLTGENQKVYKVTIDGGISFRVTGNHKFILKSGEEVEAINLKHGDSLKVMTKYKNNYKKSNYYQLRDSNNHIGEHRLISEYIKGEPLLDNEVVHHIDHNGLNNSTDNLQIMTKKEYDLLHSKDMIGELNPYHKMTDEWKQNFASKPGEKNPKYINITNKEIEEHAKILTNKLNRRFSKKEWVKYAKENNIPQSFSKYRNINIIALSKKVALELKYDNTNTAPRLVKTYQNALNNGYDAEIIDNNVLVTKKCENCGEDFQINYFRREISFCSRKCSLNHINSNFIINEKRTNSLNKQKSETTKEKQIKILSDLKFKLGRIPKLSEWENECKQNNIPFRLKTKYGFNNYSEICEEAEYYNHKVISVEEDGYENVYNGTVDDFHTFFMTDNNLKINVLTRNCGEIPLCPYDSCRLLVLNLYSYVVDPYTKNSYFDLDLFKKHCFYAQRIMDDIIDLEIEKIDSILEKIDKDEEPEYVKMYERNLWEKIKEKTIEGRRSGIGVTAEGDMLAALNLRYGTKEATDFSENVHKNMAINIYKSSCLLGQERGNFKIFDYNLEKDNPFIKRLSESDKELKELLKKGRRNISLLCIAPVGTTSMMCQTTSGIEPVFMVAYKRRRKINPNDKDTRVDFVDEVGDSWEEYTILHHGFKRWLLVNNYNVDDIMKYDQEKLDELIKLSPYYKATTDSVDWLEKVRMQGRIQKWVDHSISVTVNLPEDASEETVYNVYMESWKYGCKGVTVYREGSRSGVLISNKKEKEVSDILNERHAPKRPKMVKCSVLRFQNNKEKWVGFVGLIDDKPYEIFTGKLESFPIPNFVEHGHIKKVKELKKDEDGNDIKTSRYDFVYVDKDGYEQDIRGLSRAFNEEFWNYAKLISGILRHGMPIYNVVNLIDSLSFRGESIVSWKSGVKRMLSRYIKETDIKGQQCSDCGNEKLKYESGCVSCECGWSKCSG